MVLAFPKLLRYFNSNSTTVLGIFCQHQRDCPPNLSWCMQMAQLNLNYNPGFLPSTSRRLSLLPLDPLTIVDMESNEPAQQPISGLGLQLRTRHPHNLCVLQHPELGAQKPRHHQHHHWLPTPSHPTFPLQTCPPHLPSFASSHQALQKQNHYFPFQ
jgi:hypothetical protein